MAKVKNYVAAPKLVVTLELTEDEARALSGIFGYNVDVFLKVFYERMGKHYVQPYEEGVRSLHQTIRGELAKPLDDIDKARKAIREAFQPTTAPGLRA